MKNLIVSFALLIGIVGMAQAGGRQGQGWDVFIATGFSGTVPGTDNGTRSYLKKISLSSATNSGGGDCMVVYSTGFGNGSGEGGSLFGNPLFTATAAVTPALIFQSTASTLPSLNNNWSVGDCDGCFVEIGGDGAIVYRKTIQQNGPSGTAAIYWSK